MSRIKSIIVMSSVELVLDKCDKSLSLRKI